VAALGVALWGLRTLAGSTRRGRVGVWLALAGVALLGVFIVQVVIEVLRSGDVLQNFILFALGFLLVLVGHLLFARDLRSYLGKAWLMPIVAAAGAVVALTIEADPYHDIGLLTFEAAWVALGVVLMRRGLSAAPTQAKEVRPGATLERVVGQMWVRVAQHVLLHGAAPNVVPAEHSDRVRRPEAAHTGNSGS
jgi:hypothetical protein